MIDSHRVVILVIPAAEEIPTAFREKRFIRIGSSKASLKDYPRREIQLFKILDGREEIIETSPSKYQELTFSKLFGYYGSRGIVLKEETFIKNLGLKNNNGKFNLLAQLLSDDSHIPLRVSIFDGETKGSPLFSVREFGNTCLLYSLDEILRYGDVLNLIQTDERNRAVERKSEIFLQLHISEKSGRGVPKSIEVYGKGAFTFRKRSIIGATAQNRIERKACERGVGELSVRRQIKNPAGSFSGSSQSSSGR